jgi:hypothetical protein
MSDEAPTRIPAPFVTIHFRSDRRPDGYTADEIFELNRLLNEPEKPEKQAE